MEMGGKISMRGAGRGKGEEGDAGAACTNRTTRYAGDLSVVFAGDSVHHISYILSSPRCAKLAHQIPSKQLWFVRWAYSLDGQVVDEHGSGVSCMPPTEREHGVFDRLETALLMICHL
jgi:hypothetical protein